MRDFEDMIVAGLTGSIGMGKSEVARMLRDMNIPVHDADAEVHKLLAAGGGAVSIVAAQFPGAAGANGIDRAALGRIVFADAAKKRALEEILHPLVRKASDAFVADMKKQGKKLIVLDIPLLFETGGEKRVDTVICVTAPAEVQRARVLARPGMTPEKFALISANQMPDAEKRKRAQHIVDTAGTLEDTRARLKKVIGLLLRD